MEDSQELAEAIASLCDDYRVRLDYGPPQVLGSLMQVIAGVLICHMETHNDYDSAVDSIAKALSMVGREKYGSLQ